MIAILKEEISKVVVLKNRIENHIYIRKNNKSIGKVDIRIKVYKLIYGLVKNIIQQRNHSEKGLRIFNIKKN